jgi:hypothetical protein
LTDAPSQYHEFFVKVGLRPGNEYQVLLRAVDRDGQWQEMLLPVTLLKRTVNISFSQFDVVNDSDPDGSAEAVQLGVSVYEGKDEVFTKKQLWPELSDGDHRSLPFDWSLSLGRRQSGSKALLCT